MEAKSQSLSREALTAPARRNRISQLFCCDPSAPMAHLVPPWYVFLIEPQSAQARFPVSQRCGDLGAPLPSWSPRLDDLTPERADNAPPRCGGRRASPRRPRIDRPAVRAALSAATICSDSSTCSPGLAGSSRRFERRWILGGIELLIVFRRLVLGHRSRLKWMAMTDHIGTID